MTHPSPKRNTVPKAVLMRSGIISLTTARPVNTAQPRTIVNSAIPMTNVFNKAHSTVRRPFNNKTATKNSISNQRVNIVRDNKVNTARPKAVVNTIKGNQVNTARPKAVVNAAKGYMGNDVKASACWVWRPKQKVIDHVFKHNRQSTHEKGVIDSGCSRHMTWNMSNLTDFEEIDGGYVAFGGNPKGGKITGRGTIKTGNLDFENVYFVRELKFTLFSVSQMCDKKNSVLFNDTKCIVLSPNFKLTDESHVLLKVPRKNNMYSVDLKNIVPKEGLTCIFAKATSNESKLWHRRLGHINFKTVNKLVKGNLVRGLPSKLFEINQTCVACQKGKQHRASYDYSSFSWVFFLATKDETSGIIKSFITKVENLIDQSVKCSKDSSTKRVAERKNRTLIEATRIMLADSKLPTTFWAEAVNTFAIKPTLGFMRPFGYLITILNTIDHLGKFDGKADEGFFIGYSINSKAFRVFNSRTRIVEENLHVKFSEDTTNIAGSTKASDDTSKARMETIPDKDYILLQLWPVDPLFSQSSKNSPDAGFKPSEDDETENHEKEDGFNNTNNINNVSSTVIVGDTDRFNDVDENIVIGCVNDPNMPDLEEISKFSDAKDDNSGADMNNLDIYFQVSLVPTTRIHKHHPLTQVNGDLNSAT
ncbi:putative ribonuclease H-like domain-containing protein, partial [Tanacetum coccineum]